MCWWTASRSPAVCSISACISLPQRRRAVAARRRSRRIFICRRWRATSKRGCGTIVFNFAQDALKIPRGSIRATVLIETILATFETRRFFTNCERTFGGAELRALGLHFQLSIKKFRNRPGFTFPRPHAGHDDVAVHARIALNVIKVCHRRGAHAMGGMAAQIPIKSDPAANEVAHLPASSPTRNAEAGDGHDGTRVAHPGLVPVALQAFDKHMPACESKSPNSATT